MIPDWAWGNNQGVWELQGASPQCSQAAEEQDDPEWSRLWQTREVKACKNDRSLQRL